MLFKSIQKSQIEIITAMMQDFYAIDNYPFDIDTAKNLFEQFLENENLGKAFLIYDEEAVAGYLILTYIFSFEYQGTIAFIDELYIQDSFRNKGLGNKTIQFIKNFCKEQNIKMIYLEVENHNQKAQKLYLAHDFEIHHRSILKHKL